MREFSSLGERLKELRNEKKKNQVDIANYLNIQRQTYSSYETNGSMPSIDNLRKLANYFGVSSDFIIGLTEHSTPINSYQTDNTQNTDFIQEKDTITRTENSLSIDESELVRIYRILNAKQRHKLMSFAFDMEDNEIKVQVSDKKHKQIEYKVAQTAAFGDGTADIKISSDVSADEINRMIDEQEVLDQQKKNEKIGDEIIEKIQKNK